MPPCEQLHRDDGAPLRRAPQRSQGFDRKLAQLCGQVRQTLELSLAGECSDPVLWDLRVEDVIPAPDAGRLLVVLSAGGQGPEDPQRVHERLAAAQGYLRSLVAAAVHRRRAPQLVFRLAGEERP